MILGPIFCLILGLASATLPNYHELLGFDKNEKGIIDPTTLVTAYHEKIQPLFASGNVFADRTKLGQFALLFEARKCLSELGCIDTYVRGVQEGVDPFPRHEDTSDGSWEGVHILSPWEFRTKILGGDGSEEWLVYFTSHGDSKHVNLMREAILDGQSIMKYEKLKVGVVVCGAGEYDLCTALGKKMALILWNKQAHFKGQMNYFSLTKFLITQLEAQQGGFKTYEPAEAMEQVVKTRKPIFLVDTSKAKDAVSHSDIMTIAKIVKPFVEVGLIDCNAHSEICAGTIIDTTSEDRVNGFYVEYFEYYKELTTFEDKKSSLFGLVHADCGENAASLLDTITQYAINNDQKLIKIDATPLHKMTIKVKHGRIPPFAVYMGPKIPGIRMIALNNQLTRELGGDGEKRLYHLSCDDLELYCYRFHADEEYAKLIVFKEGGFETLYTRDTVHDKANALKESLTGKLLTMRAEDLYAKLQDGPMENTMIQYMNSTRYTMYDMDSALEKDISELRRGANLVKEVHGTTTYLVDCAVHNEVCEANKVVDSNGLHYVSPTKVIKQHTGLLKYHLYLAFVDEVSKKEQAVEDNLDDATPESVSKEFERFSNEL